MHNVTAMGPGLLVFTLFMYAVGVASLWLMVDVTRPKRDNAFAEHPRARWVWFVPQAVYLVAFVIQNLPWTATLFVGGVLVFATPFALGLQIAYLLRVVYPSPARRAARELAATTIGRLPEE